MQVGSGSLGVADRVHRLRRASPHTVLVCIVCTCVLGPVQAARAGTEPCKNEKFRTGASALLPDCRAYELVTPAEKGRTQALTFTGGPTKAAVSLTGEAVALETTVPFGPNPSWGGARAVFTRNSESGWEMHSAVAPGAAEDAIGLLLFSSDLSDVAFESATALNTGEQSANVIVGVGPVGGEYEPIASIPRADMEEADTQFLGAPGSLGDVLFASVDHTPSVNYKHLLSGAESATSEATPPGALNLYDWTGGHLRLVNATAEGLPMADPCGATLGGGTKNEPNTSMTVNAVSEDGSKVFFTNPFPWRAAASEPGCQEPAALFMRVNGGEPVEVSAQESGINLKAAEIKQVRYNYATPNGSKVFFNTETALTAGEAAGEKTANKLFVYNTEAPEGERLKLVASGVPTTTGVGLSEQAGFIFSEDGSTVYVETSPNGDTHQIYRVDTTTGEQSSVAVADRPSGASEPSYTTPKGDYLLFTSYGVEEPLEQRGFHHNEMYRYDAANGSVLCVTCGTGSAPTQGEVLLRSTELETADVASPLTQLSEDGQEVFFQTTARLVPQDVNSTETEIASAGGTPGLDVYEWEAEGSGGCELAQGCTYMLSTGEDIGPSTLLGVSRDGSNVFYATPAQLVQQDTDELPDIYDARVDGGFAPPAPTVECTSCQGVGSPPLLFNVPASGTFMGPGNPGPSGVPTRAQELARALKACRKERPKRKRAACERRAKKQYGTTGSTAKRSTARATKGGKRP